MRTATTAPSVICLGIAASVSLHALCIAALVWLPSARREREPPLPRRVELIRIASQGREGNLVDPRGLANVCALGKTYVGIGVETDPDQVVIVAPESYPAFRAGIRLGDVLDDPDVQPDARGFDTVLFTRNGQPHQLRIKTERICLR